MSGQALRQAKKIMLEPGQYRFHEEAAPEGYLVVTDFTFTVNADGTVTLGTIAQGETVVAANGKITVTDNAKPAPQTEPKKPTPKKPKTPNTGDQSNASQYASLILTSGMLMMLMAYRRKQSTK